MLVNPRYLRVLALFFLVSLLVADCSSSSSSSSTPGGGGPTYTCNTITGTAWVPSVPGTGNANHTPSNITVATTTMTASAPIIGLAQAAPAGVETSFAIPMSTGLGPYGSLMLTAQVSGFPGGLQGGAFPLLVSLNDGTNEYINLARTGASGDCWNAGYYTCSDAGCIPSTGCVINSPSAYVDRTHWEQHQLTNATATNTPSTNLFPTCNWTNGAGTVINPTCAFNTTFFPSATTQLRSGVSYTAKYVLVSDSYSSVPAGYSATITVNITKKTTVTSSQGGAFDLNIILVGDQTVSDSRTAKGSQNLNSLVNDVATIYGATSPGPNLKIGNINAIEWSCNQGGEPYATVDISQLGAMFGSSSTLVPVGEQGKSLNVFLVSGITDNSGGTAGFTILGYDGAIGGPLLAGTAVSGVTASTFDSLATYNPNCPAGSAPCPTVDEESAFREFSTVIAHELGHYFSLNHPSEYPGTQHDIIPDTNTCTATQDIGGTLQLTIQACQTDTTDDQDPTSVSCHSQCPVYNANNGTFCPTVQACQFNDVMWWTVKNYYDGGGSDGNMFSPDSSILMNYNPVVQ